MLNGNHKLSCPYGERHRNKITVPVSMLQRYASTKLGEAGGNTFSDNKAES